MGGRVRRSPRRIRFFATIDKGAARRQEFADHPRTKYRLHGFNGRAMWVQCGLDNYPVHAERLGSVCGRVSGDGGQRSVPDEGRRAFRRIGLPVEAGCRTGSRRCEECLS